MESICLILTPSSFMKRKCLVRKKTVDLAREAGIVVVISPPGTGKSSLMELITRKIDSSDGNCNAITGTILRPSRPSKPSIDLYGWVRNKTGLCYEDKTIDATVQSNAEVFFSMISGENPRYRPICRGYQGSRGCLSDVLLNKRRHLAGRSSKTAPRGQRALQPPFVYPKWETYQTSLFHLTNGNAAAFAISMNTTGVKTLLVDCKAEGGLTEEKAVKELHEGTQFLESLERCFPLARIDTKSHGLIVEALAQAYRVDVGEGYTRSSLDDDPVINSEPPESVDELIKQAATRLSARHLRVACQGGAVGVLQTPKEAVFQQLFDGSIASLLPSSYCYHTRVWHGGHCQWQVEKGELDFYILNGMKWELELRHLGGMTGKYQNVEVDEWLVLDSRMQTGRRPHPAVDRCSLVFAEDFRTCQFYIRLSEKAMTINLME
eukprot:scaffold6439_cov167-Amphora_coffeaeformis.AAC.5